MHLHTLMLFYSNPTFNGLHRFVTAPAIVIHKAWSDENKYNTGYPCRLCSTHSPSRFQQIWCY